MHDLPSGTVTFLFTDIEGSTRRWDAQRAAMSGALARHDDLLRAAIESNGGHVFKTVGDAFCAAFGSAAAALTAAVDAQRALAAEDWSAFGADFAALRVRMALHTGHAERRDGDYFGPTLNRVAGLLSAGHGGQVLLSLVTEELVGDDLPVGSTLREMGEHRLKDLFRPEPIFQLVAPDLAYDFPALKTLDRRPNNLPVQLTSFVGREREVVAINARLAVVRLLTLTGVGGTGKTRLALRVAADVPDDYPDGVWFVDLAPIVDPALVAPTLATTLGVAEQPGRAIEATLVDHLRTMRMLIVLDNCEHVIEAAAALAAELVRSTEGVRLLATSREALGATGEANYAVPTLEVPDVGAPAATSADLQALARYEAVRLFIDRAVLTKSDFTVTNANAPAVAGICQQLDGIPLAIELAAARVKHLSPEQILARLDQRFRLLTGGGRDRLPRQQTLEAAIDWSHDLLDPLEQALFRRLSVFRGGWTLEAAERVCAGDPVEDWAVVDLLLRLVDKSLVVAGDLGGEARYRFLETVWGYSRERRDAAGERETYLDRQLAYVVERVSALGEVDAAGGIRDGKDPERLMARARADNENIRAAVDWACDSANAAAAVRLGAGLWRYWRDMGQATDGRMRLTRVLAMEGAYNRRVRGFALYGLGLMLWYLQDFDVASETYSQALVAFRACGERVGESWCLNDLGGIALSRGDFDIAESYFEASSVIKREVASFPDQAASDLNLGLIAEGRGNWSKALQRYDAAKAMLDAALAPDNAQDLAQLAIGKINAIGNRGDVLLELDRLEEAKAGYQTSMRQCVAHGLQHLLPENVARFAWLAAAREEWVRAATLVGGSDRLFAEIDTTFDTTTNQRRHARATAATRAALGDAAFDAAYAEGRAMGRDEATAYALGDTDE